MKKQIKPSKHVTLTLATETLRRLDEAELSKVVGGTVGHVTGTCPTFRR